MNIKYPRTWHMPFSPGKTSDDKVLKSLDYFKNKNVIISEKMDGENTSISRDRIWARSLDSVSHVSRDWVKSNIWANIRFDIPEGWRICGENLFARHSIFYENLKSYFYGFSIWVEWNECLSWEETIEWFDILNIKYPTILYEGVFSEYVIEDLIKNFDIENREGFVMRISDGFEYDNFKNCVAKYVRKNHITTDTHWMNSKIIQNKLG